MSSGVTNGTADANVDQGNDVLAFVISTAINLASGTGYFFLFCILRPRVSWWYNSRYDTDPTTARPLPPGFFAWIPALIKVSDGDLEKYAGLDALMFIKFFSRMIKLFGCGFIFGFPLMMINIFGGEELAGFSRIALSNVKPGRHDLAGHVVCVYGFTALCFYLLRKTYADYTIFRHRYLSDFQSVMPRSVLVRFLPAQCQRQPQLEEFFRQIFGSSLEYVSIASYSKKRVALAAKREAALANLENSLAKFVKTEKRPQHRTRPCCGPKVDSIKYYSEQLESLNVKVAEAPKPEEAKSGFVTFSNLRAAHEATRVILDTMPNAFVCRLAPEVRDVCWENLNIPHKERELRELIGTGAVVALILFAIIPITAISAITTLPNFLTYLPKAAGDYIMANDALKAFLAGFLPSLANLIFLALLPVILTALAKFEGWEALSWIEKRMARSYFLFCMFTFFIVQTLSGSLLSTIEKIRTYDDVIDLLGNSIPRYGYFFSILILMRAFLLLPATLLDLPSMVLKHILKKLTGTTKRELDKWNAGPMFYGYEYANHLLIFVIAVSYSMIQPIIMVFATVYFSVGYMVAKYRVLYMSIPKYESGGLFWPDVFTHLCIGLLVSQLTLIGVFGLKKVPIEAGLIFPLPWLTGLFWYNVRKEFHALSDALPLNRMLEHATVSMLGTSPYVCPAMNSTPIRKPTAEDVRANKAKDGSTFYTFDNVIDSPTKEMDP